MHGVWGRFSKALAAHQRRGWMGAGVALIVCVIGIFTLKAEGLSTEKGFTNTPDAITTGAVQACVGAVQRMATVMAEKGFEPRRLVLSGGAAAEIAMHLPLELAIRENLVLDGLVAIARES